MVDLINPDKRKDIDAEEAKLILHQVALITANGTVLSPRLR